MPSITKSLPVVLLVGASALAGPIIRDQNGDNSDHSECIKECYLTNGLELCSLDWKQIFDPSSDYCPADIGSHQDFMRYARTCWKAMHPDDHSYDNGEDCLGHVDLCPLLSHLGPGGDDQPWNSHGGPGQPGLPLIPSFDPHGHSGPGLTPPAPPPPSTGDQPGLPPIVVRPIVIGGNGGDPGLPMPQSGQGGCPDLNLCPLLHELVPGDGPQPHGLPQGSLPPVGAPGSSSGSFPPSSAYPWWRSGNGQPLSDDPHSGDIQSSRLTFHGDDSGLADLGSNGRSRLGNSNGLDGDINIHNGDSSSRPVGDSNGPFAVVDAHGQNDPQDHHLDIIGDNDSSRNRNVDVHVGDDSDPSRQSGVPSGQVSGLSFGNNQNDGQHDSQHDGQFGEQNGLHIVSGESRDPRNTDGENGECQQQK